MDKIKVFLVASFLIVFHWAEGRDFLVKNDLSLDWLFMNKSDGRLLPFLENSSNRPYAIHLKMERDYGRETYLKISLPAQTSLFIENRFYGHFNEKTEKLFLVDSLLSLFKSAPAYFTLYRKARFDAPPKAVIGYKQQPLNAVSDINPLNIRPVDMKSEYLKLIILVVFTFFVLLKILVPAELSDFYSLTGLLTFRFTDTSLTKSRALTRTHTIVIIYQAAMMAALMTISLHFYNNPLGDHFIMSLNPFIGWIFILLLTLAAIFLKYILISLLSVLFGAPERINFYFLEYLRMAMIFYSALFVIVSYSIINQFYAIPDLLNTLIILVIIFNFVRIAAIYFKLRRIVAIKNLHLFSYLCSTELIPVVLGLNFFIK